MREGEWVYSKSSSAPHLFGDQIDDFDAQLRGILEAGAVDVVLVLKTVVARIEWEEARGTDLSYI